MAIAFDTKTQNTGTSTSPIVLSHTNTGSDLYLIVAITNESGDFVTSVTYNGVAMTLLKKGAAAPEVKYIYGLANPATGANNISVSFSSGFTKVVGASYTGVKQTGQPDATGTNYSASTSSSPFNTNITTVASNCWLVGAQRCSVSPTSSSLLSVRYSFDANNTNFSANGFYDSNGTVATGAVTWGLSFSGTALNFETIVVSLAPVARVDLTLTATVQTYTLTGIAAILRRGYSMIASAGSFLLTSMSAMFSRGGFFYQNKNITTSSYQSKNNTNSNYQPKS